MESHITELEKGLQEQLATLTTDIRTMEANLMATKEGYLKVQGALEILNVLKQNSVEREEKMIEAYRALSPD